MPERRARPKTWRESVPPELLPKPGDLLPRLEPKDVAAVGGMRGSRKSTNVKASLAAWQEEDEQEQREPTRLVAFDPHDEYSQLGHEVPGEVILGPLRNHVSVAGLLECPELLEDPNLSLSVFCESLEDEEVAADFEAVARFVMESGDCVFVVEEAALLQEKCGALLRWLATQSRHRRVALVIVSQWFYSFHYSLRKQFTHLRMHRQEDPEEIEVSAKVLRSKELAAKLATLAPGECIARRDANQGEGEKPC